MWGSHVLLFVWMISLVFGMIKDPAGKPQTKVRPQARRWELLVMQVHHTKTHGQARPVKAGLNIIDKSQYTRKISTWLVQWCMEISSSLTQFNWLIQMLLIGLAYKSTSLLLFQWSLTVDKFHSKSIIIMTAKHHDPVNCYLYCPTLFRVRWQSQIVTRPDSTGGEEGDWQCQSEAEK